MMLCNSGNGLLNVHVAIRSIQSHYYAAALSKVGLCEALRKPMFLIGNMLAHVSLFRACAARVAAWIMSLHAVVLGMSYLRTPHGPIS